jgi:ABC-type microcin C transport system duplicated ATPase subunit YejF
VTETLLEIDDLHVTFPTAAGDVKSVRGISLSVGAGEALAIVGESGAGKSVSMMAVLGLVPGAQVSGSARYRGTELLGLAPNRLRQVRGAHIAIVFQDPMTSLNPVMTVGSQIGAVLHAHDRKLSRKAAEARATELLELVAIPQPNRRVRAYPHELSAACVSG